LGEWPFPGDSPEARARRVALAYRTALELVAPHVTAELDERIVQWGQSWIVPRLHIHDPSEWLHVGAAAELLCITPAAVGALRRRGRLPARKDTRGIWQYRTRDITRLSAEPRRRGQQVTDTLHSDGRTTPS